MYLEGVNIVLELAEGDGLMICLPSALSTQSLRPAASIAHASTTGYHSQKHCLSQPNGQGQFRNLPPVYTWHKCLCLEAVGNDSMPVQNSIGSGLSNGVTLQTCSKAGMVPLAQGDPKAAHTCERASHQWPCRLSSGMEQVCCAGILTASEPKTSSD